ncbi:transposase [Streptomyces sp. NPDC007369]|uniref:transposase n=1 Tax=Streptomyces sp. NPDC007369 TaxID=3154589 RepID=UPI0033C82645
MAGDRFEAVNRDLGRAAVPGGAIELDGITLPTLLQLPETQRQVLGNAGLVDVSNRLRPDAPTSGDRLFCHVYGRGDRSADQLIPGWPYSFIAALEPGRTSGCQLLDAVRLGPAEDAALVTAAQLREVVKRLVIAGHWKPGDPETLVVMDSGYDMAYLSHALKDLPSCCSDDCARTASCSATRAPPARDRRAGGPAGTAASSLLPSPTPGTDRCHHGHGHHPLREGRDHGPGPDASQAHSPWSLAGAHGSRTARSPWHVGTTAGRAPTG